MSAVPVTGAPGELRAQAAAAWRGRTPRERQAISWGAVALGVLLVWLFAVQPALRTMREAPPRLDRLDAELQQMQRLAAESRTLRATPPVAPSQAGAALQAATARLGAAGRLALLGDRATLTLAGADAQQLQSWLAEARRAARARPIEAQLTRGPQGWTGTLTVSLGAPR